MNHIGRRCTNALRTNVHKQKLSSSTSTTRSNVQKLHNSTSKPTLQHMKPKLATQSTTKQQTTLLTQQMNLNKTGFVFIILIIFSN